jgi:hypothetical protein
MVYTIPKLRKCELSGIREAAQSCISHGWPRDSVVTSSSVPFRSFLGCVQWGKPGPPRQPPDEGAWDGPSSPRGARWWHAAFKPADLHRHFLLRRLHYRRSGRRCRIRRRLVHTAVASAASKAPPPLSRPAERRRLVHAAAASAGSGAPPPPPLQLRHTLPSVHAAAAITPDRSPVHTAHPHSQPHAPPQEKIHSWIMYPSASTASVDPGLWPRASCAQLLSPRQETRNTETKERRRPSLSKVMAGASRRAPRTYITSVGELLYRPPG